MEEDPNLRELNQQTHYGSAPEYLWSGLAELEEDPAACLVQETDKYEDQSFRHLLFDMSDFHIMESIAQAGQAHVFLAEDTQLSEGSGIWKIDFVIKRYKGCLGVCAVHELGRRIAHVGPKARLC